MADTPNMATRTRFYRRLALFSYLGLVVWMPLWLYVLAEKQVLSAGFVFLFFILPLLLPGIGILKGKPYTHAWANFIVMLYLLHGLTSIYAVSEEWRYALLELVLATGMFIGCSFYARLRGKELGLGIKKLKQEMAEERAFFEGRD